VEVTKTTIDPIIKKLYESKMDSNSLANLQKSLDLLKTTDLDTHTNMLKSMQNELAFVDTAKYLLSIKDNTLRTSIIEQLLPLGIKDKL
jgi:hypothetical protein